MSNKELMDIEKRLNEVLRICEREHNQKIELKAENYDLKKQLEMAQKRLNMGIRDFKVKSMPIDKSKLTASQRKLLARVDELQRDMDNFSKKVDSIAYSMDIKSRIGR